MHSHPFHHCSQHMLSHAFSDCPLAHAATYSKHMHFHPLITCINQPHASPITIPDFHHPPSYHVPPISPINNPSLQPQRGGSIHHRNKAFVPEIHPFHKHLHSIVHTTNTSPFVPWVSLTIQTPSFHLHNSSSIPPPLPKPFTPSNYP